MTSPREGARARSVSPGGSPQHEGKDGDMGGRSKTSMGDGAMDDFKHMRDDPMFKLNEAQWKSKGVSFSAVSRPGAPKTPAWSYKRKLKGKVDPKLYLMKHDGMHTMQKEAALGLIQEKRIKQAIREADHKKRYAEKVVSRAKKSFEQADEDGGGSLDVEELIEVVQNMREDSDNPVRSLDEKIKLRIEANEAVHKYGTLDYDERGVELRAITFDGFLSMLGYEPWKTMFGIPPDISMFQARMTILAQETFDEADADGGGSLDAQELLGVVKTLRQRMGKPITYEDGGREMRRMQREVDRAMDKWGVIDEEEGDEEEAEAAIQFKDFLRMMKVEPWKTIFGVTEGLRKEKQQLALSRKAEDRRHTKAFIKRLDVLRGKIARNDTPQVKVEPYSSDHMTLAQEVDRYRPSGGVPVGIGGHNPVKAVLVSQVERLDGPGSFIHESPGVCGLGPNYYDVHKATPGIAEDISQKLLRSSNNDYYKKLLQEGTLPDGNKSKTNKKLNNRSIFACNHLKIHTRGGGGKMHTLFPRLSQGRRTL